MKRAASAMDEGDATLAAAAPLERSVSTRSTGSGLNGPPGQEINAETLLKHQNRELSVAYRRVKRRLVESQRTVDAYEVQRDALDAKAAVLDRSWRQLELDLQRALVHLGAAMETPPASDKLPDAPPETSALRDNGQLQSLLSETDPLLVADATNIADPAADQDADPESEIRRVQVSSALLNQALQERTSALTKVLGRVLSALPEKPVELSGVSESARALIDLRAVDLRARVMEQRLTTARTRNTSLRVALETAQLESQKLSRRIAVLEEETKALGAQIQISSTTPPLMERGASVHVSMSVEPALSGGTPQLDGGASAMPQQQQVEASAQSVAQLVASIEENSEDHKLLADSRLAEIETLRRSLAAAEVAAQQAARGGEQAARPPPPTELQRELQRERELRVRAEEAEVRAIRGHRMAEDRLREAVAQLEQLNSMIDAFARSQEANAARDAAEARAELKEIRAELDRRTREVTELTSRLERVDAREKTTKALEILWGKRQQAASASNGAIPSSSKEDDEPLIAEIESLTTALEAAREQCLRLESVIAERDQRVSALTHDKFRLEEELRTTREEKSLFSLRFDRLQASLQEQESQVSRIEQRAEAERSARARAEDLAKESQEIADRERAEKAEAKRAEERAKESVEVITARVATLEQELDASIEAMRDMKSDAQRNQEEVQTLKRRFDRARNALEQAAERERRNETSASSSGGGGSSNAMRSADEFRLESMELALRCPVYKHLWKDSVITKCAHMFSRSALEDNLAQRNRKCPTCKTFYSRDDILSVYLYQRNE